jgi:hypothetical protein
MFVEWTQLILPAVGTFLGKVAYDGFKSRTPEITDWVIDRACGMLDEPERGRYSEEWRAHAASFRDISRRWIHAFGCTAAAIQMRWETTTESAAFFRAAVRFYIFLDLWLKSLVSGKHSSSGAQISRNQWIAAKPPRERFELVVGTI